MAFVKNAWYCAAWASELDDGAMVGRKLVGEHVLLYRTQDGTAVAMGDACPHRFAPLHLGVRKGDSVACPYHGLEFGPDGACTLNPHGDGSIPEAAKVKSYTLAEKWNALWIWPGDPAKADPETIPDFSMTMPREGWSVVYGHHTVDADYQLVVDNLLDRTHVMYLHPLLQFPEIPEDFREEQSTEQHGDLIWDYHAQYNCPKYPLLTPLWPDAPERTENYFNVRWEAPGNMLLDSGTVEMGTDRKVGSHTPMANLVTPADEQTTHYFWNQARDRNIDNPEIDAKIQAGVAHTFKNEDGAIIVGSQELMGTADLFSLNPLFLPGDQASIRARRILARRLEEEAAEVNGVTPARAAAQPVQA